MIGPNLLKISQVTFINVHVHYMFFQIYKTAFKETICLNNSYYNTNKEFWQI